MEDQVTSVSSSSIIANKGSQFTGRNREKYIRLKATAEDIIKLIPDQNKRIAFLSSIQIPYSESIKTAQSITNKVNLSEKLLSQFRDINIDESSEVTLGNRISYISLELTPNRPALIAVDDLLKILDPLLDKIKKKHENIYQRLTNLSNENKEFVEREEFSKTLQEGWKSPELQNQALVQKSSRKYLIQVLTGMGGVGKTQVAFAFAHTQQQLPEEQRPSFIRWMNAEGSQISISMRTLAEEIDPHLIEKSTDPEILINLYKRLKEIPRWLLIFDNIKDYDTIKPYLPPSNCSQIGQNVLLTSNSSIWPNQIIKQIVVGVFTPSESLNYFLKCFPDLKAESAGSLRAEILGLAEELGYLPLALSHAAAYMQNKSLGVSDYHKRYKRKGLSVLKEHPIDEALPYPHTVLTTWLMAIEQLKKNCPEAITLLNHCAFLAPNIKREKLNSWLNLFKSNKIFDQAIMGLRRYSLVNISYISNEDILVFHRLVQKVTLYRQTISVKQRFYNVVVNAVWKQVKNFNWKDPQTWFCMKIFLGHSEMLLAQKCAYIEVGKYTAALANRVQDYFWTYGNYEQAQAYAEQALALARKRYERYREKEIEIDIARYLHNLGAALRDRDKLQEAWQSFKDALQMKYKIYNDKTAHIEIGITLNALGMVLERQGYYKKAQKHYEKALDIIQNDMNIDSNTRNLNIAVILHNLGSVLQHQGLILEAKKNYKRSLEIKEIKHQIYDKKIEDPDVALTLYSLGTIYQKQKKYLKAKKCYDKALEIFYLCYGHESTHAYITNTLQRIKSNENELTLKMKQSARYSIWCKGTTAAVVGVAAVAISIVILSYKN